MMKGLCTESSGPSAFVDMYKQTCTQPGQKWVAGPCPRYKGGGCQRELGAGTCQTSWAETDPTMYKMSCDQLQGKYLMP
jgi:hypothetical protein